MYGVLMLDVAGLTLTPQDIDLLAQPQVGGIILFARNVDSPEQVRQLCNHIRQVQPHILIAVDQEGGRVARLRQGFTCLPAMGQLGQYFNNNPIDALSLSFDCGYLMAAEVLAVGIDFSFAPVLDVDGISQVIGDRSFHQTPQGIVALANQFMQGMKAAGMATTGKHFPGHGSVAPDSHHAQAIDDRDYASIYAHDMQPFLQTLPFLDALMPAHVIFSKVDDKPAGFSAKWLQQIIRKDMAFDGVLFSDDLSMQAAHIAGDAGKRVMAAINAGCDMALVCNDRESALIASQAAQNLDYPNQQCQASQQRLERMRANIPNWQGTLAETCQQFDHWQTAKTNVSNFLA